MTSNKRSESALLSQTAPTNNGQQTASIPPSAPSPSADPIATVGFNETLDPATTANRETSALPISFANLISEAEFENRQQELEINAATVAESSTDLASLEAIALERHPELRRAQARIAQAQGQASQAALPYNPVLQYQSDEIGNDDTTGLHSVTLSQQIVTANKLGIAQQQQLHIVQQMLAEYELARLRVLTRVRTAYAEMFIAQQRQTIADSIAKLATRSSQTVQSLMEAGEVSRIAFLQARVEAQQATLAAYNAAATFDQKRRALAATIGVTALPAETVRGELPEQLEPQPWQTLSDQIAALSPQVSSAASQLESARWALQLACARVTPDVTGQVGVGYDAATDDTFAVIGVSVPLPVRNRNQGNIRSARASISAASAAINQTELALQASLADAVGRYEIARQTYQQLREEILPDAEEAFELARKAFESEEANFLQVLTAQRTWFDTRLAAINALQAAKTADAEIQGALTTLVPAP